MSAPAPAFATPIFEELGVGSIGFRGLRVVLPHEPEGALELDLSEPPELKEPRHVLPAPEVASMRARSSTEATCGRRRLPMGVSSGWRTYWRTARKIPANHDIRNGLEAVRGHWRLEGSNPSPPLPKPV